MQKSQVALPEFLNRNVEKGWAAATEQPNDVPRLRDTVFKANP
jgi:hypothetical protein